MRRVRTAGALERQVAAFLVGLGSTGVEIAARLAREGVRGVPGDTDDCAVAVYLHAVLGPDHQVRSVTVNDGAVAVSRCRRRGISVPLPEPVRAFIGEFDKGRFPVLVRAGDVNTAGAAAEAVHAPPGVSTLSGLDAPSSSPAGSPWAADPQAADTPGASGPGAVGPAPERPLD